MIVASRYEQRVDTLDAEGNPYTVTNRFYWKGTSNAYANGFNFYLEYKVRLNSNVDYDIYWVANDDFNIHIIDNPVYREDTLQLYQKLYISLPHEEPLRRDDSGKIYNNYNDSLVFVGHSVACTAPREVKLKKYYFDQSTDRQFATRIYEGENSQIFSVSKMGESTFYVCNTAVSKINLASNYAGFIFLDYIRLIPRIEEE
ncbi:MAG: hypothetical protein LUD15_07010 [Bacteroides sp.]|nr:hypothetical protein [Bacteroides sp.]